MRAVGTGRWLLVVALLLLVNVPVVAALNADRRVASDGVETTAEVVDTRRQADDYAVVLRFDEDLDVGERPWPVRVEEATYEQARTDGTLVVRAVPGEPGAFEAPGELSSRTGLWMTLLGNVLIGAWVWVMVRRARSRDAAPGDDAGDQPDPDAPEGGPGPARA